MKKVMLPFLCLFVLIAIGCGKPSASIDDLQRRNVKEWVRDLKYVEEAEKINPANYAKFVNAVKSANKDGQITYGEYICLKRCYHEIKNYIKKDEFNSWVANLEVPEVVPSVEELEQQRHHLDAHLAKLRERLEVIDKQISRKTGTIPVDDPVVNPPVISTPRDSELVRHASY